MKNSNRMNNEYRNRIRTYYIRFILILDNNNRLMINKKNR